ncbi:MAG TPA: hypothetical protein DCY00_06770 [Actinobacteria bacterium]|nr:hypothetical protein [Actinomycetota bacterium]
MEKHFINLTNGIEQIPNLKPEEINFLRIQSTTLERKNYYKLFSELDNNFLMNLVLGNKCIVYDFGTNKPLSKTIYLGLPIIEYCLNKYWTGYEADKVMVGRKFQCNIKDYVEKEIYQKYFMHHGEKTLQAKINLTQKFFYFKKFIRGRINLIGVSKPTNHDSDILFYKNIIEKYLRIEEKK